MAITVSDKPTYAAQSGHWYRRDGSPAYTVIGANGKERATTIRDARKLGLLPSVTTILKAAAKPGLERWKAEQLLMAALTLPQLPAETEAQWIQRVWDDSIQQAVKAANRGTEIHGAVEKFFRGGFSTVEPELLPYVKVILEALDRLGPQVWNPEKSFSHPLGYGGKVDLHSDSIVLDIKSKDGDIELVQCFDEHFMQVAAYSHGLGKPSARNGIVFVSRDKPVAKLMMHSTEERDHGWAMFKTLLAYWQEANEYAPGWGG